MTIKPSLAKGTRDFGPDEMMKRKFIFHTLEETFILFGFKPIETPCMENMSTLGGKYGEEGDKLLFRILDSGDYLVKFVNTLPPQTSVTDVDRKQMLTHISEKGLRYDLTVPFARFVVMNRNNLIFPFRRYQMQPVWRADRPQKGRYREFWQCDADIIGSDSLLNEFDLICLVLQSFAKLGIKDFNIHLNNRKLLEGIADWLGVPEQFTVFSVMLDKLDKIGKDAVFEELIQLGIDKSKLNQIAGFLEPMQFNKQTILELKTMFGNNEKASKGIAELEYLLQLITDMNAADKILIDCALARGLDYYTGCVFEVKPTKTKIGSIAAGGRYDDLTGIFNMPGLSGVGISFGADRIYDLMLAENLFPELPKSNSIVLFCHLDEAIRRYCAGIAQQLRTEGIAAECYPDNSKLKKQLDYANNNQIAFVVIVGENERESEKLTLKNMQSGEQFSVTISQLKTHLK